MGVTCRSGVAAECNLWVRDDGRGTGTPTDHLLSLNNTRLDVRTNQKYG